MTAPRQPGDRIGACEIFAAIGSGGMGVVYRGRDRRLRSRERVRGEFPKYFEQPLADLLRALHIDAH